VWRERTAKPWSWILLVVEVEFPDGTRVRALSIYQRQDYDEQRDFGLYMYEKWQPTWPAELIAWPNFGVPADWERAAVQFEAAFARTSRTER
jgi:hypothetical protein